MCPAMWRCVPLAVVVVALAGSITSQVQAASATPTLLGVSFERAVTDGKAVTFGVGTEAKISRDRSTAPEALGLSPGCRVTAASSGTGLVSCGGELPWNLISLRTGDIRPLAGAGQFSGPLYDGGTVLGMGSRWIAGRRCDESCEEIALQWHTGVHRPLKWPQWSDWNYPNTSLDSPTLRPGRQPYVQQNTRTNTFKYHRDRFTRSLGVRYRSRVAITEVHVSGWRVRLGSVPDEGRPQHRDSAPERKDGPSGHAAIPSIRGGRLPTPS